MLTAYVTHAQEPDVVGYEVHRKPFEARILMISLDCEFDVAPDGIPRGAA